MTIKEDHISIYLVVSFFIFFNPKLLPAQVIDRIDSAYSGDVKITIDRPTQLRTNKKNVICFYALPNGNSTEQTMGKKMEKNDDWHYDIQHIRAQTLFIRNHLKHKNFIVVYLENKFRSWPTWKQKHPDFAVRLPLLLDSIANAIIPGEKEIMLNGHSGGGSLIFGWLAGQKEIPSSIKRISFIDSDYGYDSSYYNIIRTWLVNHHDAFLNVFAYNDSIVVYNGKPLVSPTGGTWYRSHQLLKDLQNDFTFNKTITDSLIIYKSTDNRIQFYFKINIDAGIYHTQQVELNGFIHSVLCGTKEDSRGYLYYGKRAYSGYIR